MQVPKTNVLNMANTRTINTKNGKQRPEIDKKSDLHRNMSIACRHAELLKLRWVNEKMLNNNYDDYNDKLFDMISERKNR